MVAIKNNDDIIQDKHRPTDLIRFRHYKKIWNGPDELWEREKIADRLSLMVNNEVCVYVCGVCCFFLFCFDGFIYYVEADGVRSQWPRRSGNCHRAAAVPHFFFSYILFNTHRQTERHDDLLLLQNNLKTLDFLFCCVLFLKRGNFSLEIKHVSGYSWYIRRIRCYVWGGRPRLSRLRLYLRDPTSCAKKWIHHYNVYTCRWCQNTYRVLSSFLKMGIETSQKMWKNNFQALFNIFWR